MAKRGKTRNPGYKAGSHWANCFSCGFAFRQEDLKKTWDNRWVCDEDWEPRHPQDFLRTHKERIGVDEPVLLDDTTQTPTGGIPTWAENTDTIPDSTF